MHLVKTNQTRKTKTWISKNELNSTKASIQTKRKLCLNSLNKQVSTWFGIKQQQIKTELHNTSVH